MRKKVRSHNSTNQQGLITLTIVVQSHRTKKLHCSNELRRCLSAKGAHEQNETYNNQVNVNE